MGERNNIGQLQLFTPDFSNLHTLPTSSLTTT
jgi:hypothetical protein